MIELSAVAKAALGQFLSAAITGTRRRLLSFAARTDSIQGGARRTVLAGNPDDAKIGAPPQAHHLAMAKGEAVAGATH